MTISPALRDFLLSRENIEMTCDLPSLIFEAKLFVFEQFWERIKADLENRLKGRPNEHRSSVRWKVWKSANVDGGHSDLAIVDTRDPGIRRRNTKRPVYFNVCFQCLTWRKENLYYGINRREKSSSQPSKQEEALLSSLNSDNFETTENWPGRKDVDKAVQSQICISERKAVIVLNKDNLDTERPVARQFADLAWDLFKKHKETMEILNEAYPPSDF